MTWETANLIVGAMLGGALPTYWLVGLSILAAQTVRRHRQRPSRPQAGQSQQQRPQPPPADYKTVCIWPLLDLKGGPFTRDEVLAAYRRSAKLFHPDTGATHEAFIALIAERERALREAAAGHPE